MQLRFRIATKPHRVYTDSHPRPAIIRTQRMSTLSECPVAHSAHVTQILAGQALEWFEPPTRERLEDRFQLMESPALEVGRLAVESALRCFAWRLANTIHRNFLARLRHATPCGFAARELTLVRGDEGDVFVRASIAVWAECFRKDFLAAHDSASHRARRLLERSAATSMTVGRFSRDVGVGHRTLERQFRTQIRMSIAEYRTRRRLVEALRQIHGEHGSIDG